MTATSAFRTIVNIVQITYCYVTFFLTIEAVSGEAVRFSFLTFYEIII